MKKTLAILLVVVMCISLLASCGKGNDAADSSPPPSGGSSSPSGESSSPPGGSSDGDTGWGNVKSSGVGTAHLPDSSDPPITFTVFAAGSGTVPSTNNKALKELERITGVKFEWEFTPGDIDQKVGVVIAGGDYADWIAPGQHRGEFLNSGAFANLDGLIQDYPHLWKHFGLYEQRLRNATVDNSIRLLDLFGRRYYVNDGNDINYEGDYNGPAF